ncbi:MAG: DNA-damage-inducible protein D, partial [Patescibacteria group bacterium]
LRDHMTDWELILTMFGEKATTDITKEKESRGFEECKESANEGGSIAKRAREDLERSLGRDVISEENYLPKEDKMKNIK